MDEKMPLLSICIPTYNREKFLPECLDSIVCQTRFNNWDIEIIISDNASTDNTWKIIKNYQKKYNNIKYFRNNENIWWILNVLKVVELASWKYCWLMSDDDTLEDNKNIINNIINIINENHIDLMFLKYSLYDKKLEKIVNKDPLNFIDKNYFFESKKLFFDFLIKKDNYSSMILFLSIYIFKKDLWINQKAIINDFKKNPKINLHPHTSISLNNDNNKIMLNSLFWVKARDENFSWMDKKNTSYYVIKKLYFYLFKKLKYKNIKLYFLKWYLKISYYDLVMKIIKIAKKIWIYWFLSPIWRKYILKIK